MIVHERRHEGIGQAQCALGPQHIEAVLDDWRIEGRAFFFPVGDQLVQRNRVDDGTRQDVGANFRTLFEKAHGDIGRQLLQADGGGQPCGTGADDHDIIFHGLALDLIHRHDSYLCFGVSELYNASDP